MDQFKALDIALAQIGADWTPTMTFDFCNAHARILTSLGEFTKREAVFLTEICYAASYRVSEHERLSHEEIE